MSDRLLRGLLRGRNLLVVAADATEAARLARERHGLAPSSAALLGEALAAGAMIAALQKSETTRLNLQLECDGPVQGLFVDADPTGRVRGYVKNKTVHFPATPRFSTAPLFGSSGYVSVLRDIEGVFYRGAVGLVHKELAQDLEHYYLTSEQTETALALEALPENGDELGWVGGLLVQKMPDADLDALGRAREVAANGGLAKVVAAGGRTPERIVAALFGEDALETESLRPVEYYCPCTRERVLRALQAFPNGELFEMIHVDKKAEVDCHFCGRHYLVTAEELQEVLDLVDRRDAGEGSDEPPPTVH